MDLDIYPTILYPFQERVLSVIKDLDTGFHLTGGTALSRAYLHHRYSDDLDLFVNDDERFGLWADRVTDALRTKSGWTATVNQREERFVRISLDMPGANLKIEMINDVPSRVGTPWMHPTLGMVDTAENILANKVSAALDRAAPKDLADIWGLCCRHGLSLPEAITNAQGKAAGIFAPDLARVLCSATRSDWDVVLWIEPPDPDGYLRELDDLGKSLIL